MEIREGTGRKLETKRSDTSERRGDPRRFLLSNRTNLRIFGFLEASLADFDLSDVQVRLEPRADLESRRRSSALSGWGEKEREDL